ncbi:MAG: TonB-dependent receptor [Candidatus Kapaibacteriales bacterium]
MLLSTKSIAISLVFFSAFVVYSQTKTETLKDTIEVPSLTVTTTRATQQQSPVAFSNISKEELELRYTARDLPQLMQYEPSVISYSENGNFVGYTNMSLRGFDQRRMAVLVNGIPQNDPEDHNVYWINFSDIGSSLYDVQIQRGAGLINYGAAAIAGSISLTTSIEANQPGIRYQTGIGFQEFGGTDDVRQNITKNLFEVSSGITEIAGTNYAFYGKLARINSGGYRDQSWANLTSWFLSGVRFDNGFSTQVNLWGGSQRDGLAYVGLPKQFVGDIDRRRDNYNYWEYDSTGANLGFAGNTRPQEIEDFSSPHFEILNDWQINDNLEFKSSLFFYTGTGFFDFDGSWATQDNFRLSNDYDVSAGGFATNSIIRAWVGNRQGGWIPRIKWKHEGGELNAGLEMRFHDSRHWGKIEYAENLPQGFDPDYKFYEFEGDRTILSGFVRESYQLTEMINLQAGGQLVYNNYRRGNERLGGEFTRYQVGENLFQSGEFDIFSIDYLFFNPRLGAMFNFDENQSGNASVSLTSREPRMNDLYNASESYFDSASDPNLGGNPLFSQSEEGYYDFTDPLIKPERMLDIELGYRYTGTDFNIGFGGYWMEFTDELVRNGQLNIFGAPLVGNAPRTRHLGIEIDGIGKIMDIGNSETVHSLSVGGNATISFNELVEYKTVFGVDDSTGQEISIDLSGNPIAGFPPYLLNAFVQYQYAGLTARLNARHVGQFYSDNYGDMDRSQKVGDISLLQRVGYLDNVIESYTVLSADFAYTLEGLFNDGKNLTLRLQVENLANELYAPFALGPNFFPAAERSYYLGLDLGI